MLIHKCDFCGKQFTVFDEQENFGLHYSNVGYGSSYDGRDINVDLCCECFDKMMNEYVVEKLINKEASITCS